MCDCDSNDCCRNLALGGSDVSLGVDGAQVYFDTANPADTFGNENDVVFNTTSDAAFKKIGGTWVNQGTV